MNELGLSMENLYYIFGALLSRIILVENQYQEKVIPFDLNISYYLLYKFCNPSLVDHDWVDMLALLKLDSPAEYENLLENMSNIRNFYKRKANNKYIKSKLKRKNTKNSKKTHKNSIGLSKTIFPQIRMNNISSSSSNEETYETVEDNKKLAHMYLRCVEFYEDNMLPEIYYFINGFKQGLQKHKFSLQYVNSSIPKKDVIDILPEDLNNLLRSNLISVEEFSKRIIVGSGIRFVSRTIQEKMKKYLISVLKEYEKNNPAMLEKVFIFWFSTTVIPNNEIKLTVNDNSKDMMINSHTCFNELVINEVKNEKKLKEELEISINGQAISFDEPTNPNHL